MGLFTREDSLYNETVRMTGFNRYKQLLSFHAGNWVKVNLITTLGALPLAVFTAVSLLSSSSLLMLAGGFVGGAVFGPFLAALIASIMKKLMGSTELFWDMYKKSFKQNIKSSLLPGAVTGVFAGMFLFMAFMMMQSSIAPSAGTLALYFFAMFLFLAINSLFWPQLVLFDLNLAGRFRNILLFGIKYFWKVVKAVLLQMVWLVLMVLFVPFTLLVIPFLGFWYITFVSQLILYEDLNAELQIEELYGIER